MLNLIGFSQLYLGWVSADFFLIGLSAAIAGGIGTTKNWELFLNNLNHQGVFGILKMFVMNFVVFAFVFAGTYGIGFVVRQIF